MKEIIENWFKTNNLSIENAYSLLVEFLSYDKREMTNEQFHAIMQIGQNMVPIDWDYIIKVIALHNDWTLLYTYSVPDALGNRQILRRDIY